MCQTLFFFNVIFIVDLGFTKFADLVLVLTVVEISTRSRSWLYTCHPLLPRRGRGSARQGLKHRLVLPYRHLPPSQCEKMRSSDGYQPAASKPPFTRYKGYPGLSDRSTFHSYSSAGNTFAFYVLEDTGPNDTT